MTDQELELVWLPTFSGKVNDFSAWDGSRLVGRVFFSRYGWWHWRFRKPEQSERSGSASSEFEAKLAVEALYVS